MAAFENDEVVILSTKPGLNFNGTNYLLESSVGESKGSIVCIHGIGGWTGRFRELSRRLTIAGYDVIMYDFYGRGWSTYPADNIFDGPVHVNQLRELILHLKLNENGASYTLMAHSMGGALATLYANEYASEIKNIVMLSPAGLMDFGLVKAIRTLPYWITSSWVPYLFRYDLDRNVRSSFSHSSPKAIEIEERTVAECRAMYTAVPTIFDAVWQSILQFPLSDLDEQVKYVGRSHINVIVMWGEIDSIVSFDPSFHRWKKYLCDPNSGETVTLQGLDELTQKTRIITDTSRAKKTIEFVTYSHLNHDFLIEEPDRISNDIVAFLNYVEMQYAATL
jgi:pimeloyl-ACP methyl ester carboxylesterase